MSRLLCFVVLCSTSWLATASERPNVLLILCDDMGYSDIGCYGGEVKTPNLDRLASEGMRFTQCYNNAKCTTTRASLVTGLYPRFGKQGLLRSNMVTIGEVMQDAGYRTALCGKWHLGHDEKTHPFHRGFDSYYGLLDGCCNFFDPSIRDPAYKGGRVRVFGKNDERITSFPDDFYTTDAFTDAAIEAMRGAHDEDKPFFVHVTYTCPHYPLHAKPEDIEKYIGKFRMGWDTMRKNRWQRQQSMGLAADNWTLTQGDDRAYAWETANQEFEDRRMAVYAAMIDCMDQNIGRLLDTLREIGEEDNTYVFFLSDNGGCAEEPGGRDPSKRNPGPKDDYVAVGPAWGWAQNTPFKRYKVWTHEGGIATPMIAWQPRQIPSGTINRQVVHIIDFLPTLLDIAGGSYPSSRDGESILPCEGRSMLPVLRGGTREPHEQLAWYWAGNRAIRQGNWKLVWDSRVKKWELYDLLDDRCESQDLAAEHPDRVREMSEAFFAWADAMELKVK